MTKPVDRDRFIKFYPSDWRGDDELRACSLAARGLWWELCCLAFKYGGVVLIAGEVPTGADLAKQAGCTKAEFVKLAAELKRRGVSSYRADGAIFSRRLVRDAKRREINKANGDKGGNPNLVDSVAHSVNRPVNQTDNPHGSPESRTQNPEPETKKKKTPRAKRADPVPSEGFEEFWAAYPLKVAKEDAIKAWNQLAPSEALREFIGAALIWQRPNLTFEQDGQVKGTYPASWLNGKRWEDERPTALPTKATPYVKPLYSVQEIRNAARTLGPNSWAAECVREHAAQCGDAQTHEKRMAVAS